jgi:amino acid adenylation domain-containing protein
MVPHRAVCNFLRSMAEQPGLAATDAVVAVTTLSFDIAGLELWLPLVVGARVVIAPRSVTVDGGALVRLVDRTADAVRPAGGRVLLQATPATWRLMLDASWAGTPNLRMLCGGEAWSADLATPLLARGESLWNVYGPTETTIWSSVARVVDPSDVPLGEPIANTTLLVLDARREPVPIGVAGELYIGGSGVALGYLGRTDLTAERFVPDAFSFATGLTSDARMYRTGDLVRRRADGGLEYLGRIDQQVKVRGFRIELGEVEAALARLDGVQQAVVVVRGASADARLVAYVVPRGEEALGVDAMRAALRRSLPDYMVPAQYVVMRELPLTPNGKIDRRALPEPDASSGAERPAPVPPRTPLEARIAEVWRDVLGVTEVGIEDDFFALGGHSLLAMRVVARLAGVLPARVTIGDLFEGRTIAALAALTEAPARVAGADERIVRAAERGTAPLSLAQQAVWTAEQRQPDSAAYHAPIVTRVRGALNVDALQRAVDAVVARHEALRTTFEERGGEPVQVVHDGLRVPTEQMDLRGAARADVEHALERIVREPFALARGPLLRVRIVRVADAEWIVALVVHHLVFDGGSEPILLRELGEAYGAVVAGNTPFLGPNAIELADWARWERAQVDGTRLDGALRYWRETLAGAPAAIALPTDAPLGGQDARDGRDADRAARVVSVYSPELHEKVTRLARSLEATPFMVLLAGFQAVLSRFARQDDLVIGTPVSRRDRAETQPLIGFLTNTVPLRATLEASTSFADLVVSARERLLSGFAHSSVPVERIAAELGGGALFDTLFVLQEPQREGGLRLAGCTTEPAPVEIGAAKVDLSLSMTPTAAGLRAALIYRVSRFQSYTAERLLEHLGRLLDAAADDPTARVADLPLLGESDRATLAAWNDTRVDLDGEHTVHELVAATAARTPYAVAVEDEHESLSYEELEARASHLAQALREAGIGPGKLVGISAERSVGMVVGLLGILKAGGAYVPIDPEYPADRVTYMLADSGVSVLLTQTHLAGSLPAHGAQLVLLDDPTLPWAHDDDPPPSVASNTTPDDLAYMIYTSGSTGRPKGSLNAHRGIVNRLRWIQQTFPLGADDRLLQKTPFSFDVSVPEFFWPLLAGARLVMSRPGGHRDPTYVAGAIRAHGITICHFVPSMLRAFLATPTAREFSATLRLVMASGEALAPDLVAQYFAQFPTTPLYNLYGPTECAVEVSWWSCPPSTVAPGIVPIGRPTANTRLHVLDASLRELPIGVPGELHIGGVQVGRGYHNRPELTNERFVADPFATGPTPAAPPASAAPPACDARLYKTGDLARWRADGVIEYLGRLDFQVKLRGHRIELGEIEQLVASIDGVRGALAMLHEDPVLGARLVCYYVASEGTATPESLTTALRRELPEIMVPSAFIRLDAWPISPNGKVDRRALPAPPSPAADDAGQPPRTAVERVLCRLMAEVLGRETVSVTSDFFALGGHSLLATRVVTQSSRLFRISMTLRGFFAAPTVAGLAEAILAALGAERAERIATLAEQVQRMTPEERERLRAVQAQRKQEVGIS